MEIKHNSLSGWMTSNYRPFFWLLALLLIAYHLFSILNFGVAELNGKFYSLLNDDIMISMRYAKNLAEGKGLIFNEGERVEGFTNPLLTFIASILHVFHFNPAWLALYLNLINLSLSILILYMLVFFWGNRPINIISGLFAGILYITLPNHLYYAYAGFEVYLFAAILLYTLYKIEDLDYLSALIIGLLPLTHGTAIHLWGIILIFILFTDKKPLQKRLKLIGLALIPFLSYELFRILYYHDILPNTYYLKANAGSIHEGIKYINQWIASISLICILALYTFIFKPSKRVILAWILIISHVIAITFLGGDIIPQSRFLFPISIIMTTIATIGLLEILKKATEIKRVWSRSWVLTIIILLMVYFIGYRPFSNYHKNRAFLNSLMRWNTRHVALGLALKENTPPDSKIGLFAVGSVGYYSDRYIIDMLGKVDTHIAHTKATPGWKLAHNKVDFDYVINKSPDFIELNYPPQTLNDFDLLIAHQKGEWGFAADLALNKHFRERYSHNPVTDTKGRFLQFYAKSPSSRNIWKISESYFNKSDE